MITTFDEARLLIRELKICTVFESSSTDLDSLWEHVDLPEKQEGETGWGQKVSAVWNWKNLLPATFPEEIFYGKIKGGVAVLMTLEYLRDVHFSHAFRPAGHLNPLAEKIFEMIRNEPWETTALRKEAVGEHDCSKSQFDTALKNLQVTLNIARSNDPAIERDTWLAFQELYPEIWNLHAARD